MLYACKIISEQTKVERLLSIAYIMKLQTRTGLKKNIIINLSLLITNSSTFTTHFFTCPPDCIEANERQVVYGVKGPEHKSHEEELSKLRLFSLERRSLKGDLTALYKYLKYGRNEMVAVSFPR